MQELQPLPSQAEVSVLPRLVCRIKARQQLCPGHGSGWHPSSLLLLLCLRGRDLGGGRSREMNAQRSVEARLHITAVRF